MASATRRRRAATHALTRAAPPVVTLTALAEVAHVHPGAVSRLVALGLVQPRGGTAAAPLFDRRDAALLARAVRLRRDLGVNYAGAVLASELLSRIEDLEQRLGDAAPAHNQQEVIAWTRTGSR
jgi:chaperone modulatory protein CbpM